MAPQLYFSRRKVLLSYLALFLFSTTLLFCACSESQLQSKNFHVRRRMLEVEKDDQPKKKTTSLSTKNQTKLIKPSLSSKNQTKLFKPSLSGKNQTKLAKPSLSLSSNQTKLTKASNSTKSASSLFSKIQLKKLNSTSKIKKLNSTSKPADLLKLSAVPKNRTTKTTSTKDTQTHLDKKPHELESGKASKNQMADKKPNQQKTKKQPQPSWIDQEGDQDDFGSGLTDLADLPNKFQKTLIPDLEKFSSSSKAYLNKANKEITKGFKPIVGNKYAPTIATAISCAFIFIPFLLVSLIFNRIKAYFSLQKLLIFIQIYLCIYFSILCLSSLVTGLEPLRFFYSTSQSTYVCLQVLQTLGYVLYLLLLLMYLILVFSTECGLGSKLLGLAQIFVGFAIGLHYYMAVFHRMVLHQPPQTNWKVHGAYATCFLVICLFATADRRKKSYMEDGGEEGKKN